MANGQASARFSALGGLKPMTSTILSSTATRVQSRAHSAELARIKALIAINQASLAPLVKLLLLDEF
jgi:hypothetical protein